MEYGRNVKTNHNQIDKKLHLTWHETEENNIFMKKSASSACIGFLDDGTCDVASVYCRTEQWCLLTIGWQHCHAILAAAILATVESELNC